jgi:hypothetical protein
LLKKTITYENPFTEKQVSEEHYFHISKADLVQMEMEEHAAAYTAKDGKQLTGMQAKLQRIVDSEDGKAIMSELRDMIRRSYGRRDGDRFIKNDEVWQEFSGTEAYSQLIYELCTDAGAAAQFMTGIVPSSLEQEAAKLAAQAQLNGGVAAAEAADGRTPAELSPEEREQAQTLQHENMPSEARVLTMAEVETMDPAEFQKGIANGKYKLS